MLLDRLMQDALKHTSVLQAFDELNIPPIPDYNGQFAPVAVPEPAVKSEEQQEEDKAFSKENLNEFQGLAESLLSQTVFNLMQVRPNFVLLFCWFWFLFPRNVLICVCQLDGLLSLCKHIQLGIDARRL